MPAQFQVGDKVVHIFGGPIMSVATFEVDGVWCEWAERGHPHSKQFPLREVLHLSDAAAPRKCGEHAA